jgi:ribose 5-phosphate isomerase B
MKIFIGADHAAFEMKELVKKFLQSKYPNIVIVDVGTHSLERCDYPDFASAVARSVANENSTGILLCGSGIGVSIVANRYKGIRAALCRSIYDAQMARNHNDANILCLGARTNSEEEIKDILNAWLTSSFEGGRHADRLKKFQDLGENC